MLTAWAKSVVRTPSTGYVQFRIDGPPSVGPERFVPEHTYMEVRVAQMHVRDKRVLWREFVPLGTVTAEFQFGAGRRMMPFVVGPELLAGAPNRNEGELVEFFDTRVAGPFPYLGDDVVIFVSLARMESRNWARQVLGLLGTLASTFDVSQLSRYVDVAGGLTTALQALLGMDEVEQRVGVHRTFSTPPDDPQAPEASHTLRPGHHVFMNADPQAFAADRQRSFTMRDGRLHEDRQLFTAEDFMVLEILAVAQRRDYATFDSHRVHWREAEKHVNEGRPAEARRRLQMLASDLVTNDDLVYSHRQALVAEYSARLSSLIAQREELLDSGGEHGFESQAVAAPLDEGALVKAIERRARDPRRSPEGLLAELAG